MENLKSRHLWMLLILFVHTGSAALPEESYRLYTGTASERRSLNFLYGESHVLRYVGDRLADRVVLYTCRDGSPFARKIVRYVDPWAPDGELEDVSTGLHQGIRSAGSERSVFFRNGHGAKERSGPLPRISGLVADAGFDEFIRANWQPLLAGKSQALHFLVPSRLKEMAFEVYHLRSDTEEGKPAEVFRLKLAGALSWITSPIDVTYSASDHVLVGYAGVTDLRDSSGSNLEALISFRGTDRSEGDAQGMSAALQARLAACR
ncbi:MAG: hypothetical protein NVS9B2_24930 [Steroidobacteraceae bacterium]